MKDIVREYQEQFRRYRMQLRRSTEQPSAML